MCFQIIKTVFLLSSFAILTLSQSQIQISCGLTEWPDTCPDSKDPVCAPTPHECETTPCFQNTEYSSACEACKDAGVSSYRFGKCQYSCDPENLPPSDALADQDFPACAYYQQNCKDATCRNSFGRASIACQDGAVLYFELQTCPGKNLDPVIIIDLEDDENGNPPPEEEEEEEPQEEPVPVEEENTVIIEEESPIIVEEESTIVVEEESPVIEEEEGPIEEQPIVEEEQQGNQVIVLACSNTDTQDCNQFYRPVCPIDCQDDSQCGKTVINACQACTDPNIISYTPGTCRSERTWCRDVFSPEEDLPCSINFDPVCIYKLDCAEEPCGKTARNVCDACGTREGDYFIKGGCIGN